MRTILIAAAAVAVLVGAGVWYAIDQNLLGGPAGAPTAGDSTAPSGPTTDTAAKTTPAEPTKPDEPVNQNKQDKQPAAAPADEPQRETASRDEPAKPQTEASASESSDDAPKIAEKQAAAPGQPAPQQPATTEAETAEPAPSFDVVRIAREGTAVMAGRGPANAEIVLQRDGEELARTKADAAGEWVIVLDEPLPEGPGVLGLVARLPNGKERTAEASLAVDVPTRPTAPAQVAQAEGDDKAAKPDREGAVAVLVPKSGDRTSRILQRPPAATAETPDVTVDKLDYDETGNVVVAGTAAPGATVRVYVDNEPVGDAKTGESGEWALRPGDPIVAGQHTLRADRIGDKGDVVSRVELPFDRAPRRDILKLTASRRVIVQPGNSLWRISRRVYGTGFQYTVIYRANSTQIRDPDLIYPGQIFDLPDGATATN